MGDICAALEMLHSLAHQNVSLATNVVNVLLGSSSILNTAVTFSRADRPLSQVGQSTAYSSTRLLMWLVERIVHSSVGFFGGIGHKFLIIVCVTFDYVVSAGSNTVNVWIYGHQTESELLVTGLSRQPCLSLPLCVFVCVIWNFRGSPHLTLWPLNCKCRGNRNSIAAYILWICGIYIYCPFLISHMTWCTDRPLQTVHDVTVERATDRVKQISNLLYFHLILYSE